MTLVSAWLLACFLNRIKLYSTESKLQLRQLQSFKNAVKVDVNYITSTYANWVGCISHREATKLLIWRENAISKKISNIESNQVQGNNFKSVNISLDLGFSERELYADESGVGLLKCSVSGNIHELNYFLTWEEVDSISRKKNACFALYDDGSKPWQISTISKTSGRPASLCPAASSSVTTEKEKNVPTLLLGGFTMHRISGENMNPGIDTEAKLASIKPLYFNRDSKILDTCMGLGYTCIGAAQKLQAGASLDSSATGRVTTVELDDASIEMCAYNPWSRQLFDGSLPIDILQGDVCEVIKSISPSSLDLVIHDPPARALCESDLYGLAFYRELHRVLRKPSGCLFHYIGNPSSKESGRLYKGIVSRLKEAGFRRLDMAAEAFGLVAYT